MNLSVGIIGLPNVGKSTLFNALLKKQQAFVANFPFATIEPNIGIVPVPDSRLEKLAEIIALESAGPVRSFPPAHSVNSGQASAQKAVYPEPSRRVGIPSSSAIRFPPIVSATVNFVDIAGLVKGASEGAGLGNKFLSHVREVSIIAHVVRAFIDDNIVKEGSVDPRTDYGTIQTELILADLESLERLETGSHRKPSILYSIEGRKQRVIDKLKNNLNKGIPAREIILIPEEQEIAKTFFLLSAKPEIIVLNVSERDYNDQGIETTLISLSSQLDKKKDNCIVVSAKIESELAELSEEEQKQYLLDLGVKESGLERLIKKAYQTLGLISFLTAGEKEIRAWTIQKGTKAVEAAGVIHTDFTNKFIKAEVVSYNDFVSLGGWKAAREKGKARLEGRDYCMQDGDIVEFKIGA